MALFNRNFTEKREFIRMKVNTPAQFKLPGDDQTFEATCHDLSGGGMLLGVGKDMSLDNEVEVTLVAGKTPATYLHALCKITRIEEGPEDTQMVGLAFSEIFDDDLAYA